ncbi:MAG: GNAT family N-acetyltransferase [bacterium]|nr:GNAT family N-acetyltransferase [bacterium]
MTEAEITRYDGGVGVPRPVAAAVAHLRRRELLAPERKSLSDYSDSDARSVHFVARAGEQLAGYVQYDPEGRRLRQLIVASEYRAAGLGRALVAAVRDEGHRRGAPELRVHAWTDSVGFYRCVGFRPVGEVQVDGPVPWLALVMPL